VASPKKEVFLFTNRKLFTFNNISYLYRKIYEMSKLRKEVLLEQEVIHKLVILADKKQWSLKKMMESILIKAVKNISIAEENNS